MISSISSSDNKRHIALTAIGGAAWGGQKKYITQEKNF